jgi:disulfide bond formation protein DsbB
MALVRFVLRWWAAFALAASLTLLGVAYFIFEKWLGYPPCHLCIQQRWIYVGVAVIGAIGLVWALMRRPPSTPRPAALLILLGFAWETYTAVYHAGVEQKWWHGPATCTGGGPMDMAAIRNLLNGGAVHTPMCDVVVWSFGGLSMAGWNAVAAGVLTLVSLAAVLVRPEARRGR